MFRSMSDAYPETKRGTDMANNQNDNNMDMEQEEMTVTLTLDDGSELGV